MSDALKLSEMVSAGPGVEVTVLVAKSEVLNYNNLSKSKEDAIKWEECGEEQGEVKLAAMGTGPNEFG